MIITKKPLYCIYKTDEWFSRDFKRLVGVFTNKKRAINALKIFAIESKEPLTTDDYYNIESINRTKSRKINFIIEQTTLNEILYNNL